MIHTAIETVARALNTYLKNKYGLDENIVVVSGLVNPDGSIPNEITNKIVLTLVNTRQDMQNRSLGYKPGADINQNISLNLSVIIAASFNDYAEALKFHYAAIEFMHANPIFQSDSGDFERLTTEPAQLSFEDTDHVWQTIGCKYIPSSVYWFRVSGINN